ncbi:alpha/beta hydrolase [Cytobacillus sp. FJAT-53684]|uniref:Alpha/beta hydrolase n=1 Tax=Cytobacillus mangrovibacter TaxID=3299024 RepID=A0ABW6K4S4_9BACI
MNKTCPPYSIPGTEQWHMVSQEREQEYQIFMYKPKGPAPIQGFPVLYLLDANALFGSVVEAVRLQTRKPHGFEPIVVVGIGYQTDEPFDLKGRFWDYTVQATNEELPLRKNGMQWPEVGGADSFIHFIENQLKPVIESKLEIDRERQALFGHSLGGFFTLYSLFNTPDLFQTYIAGSPSIWWKNNYINTLEDSFFQKLKDRNSSGEKALLIGIGAEEKGIMVEDAEQMYARLSAWNLPNFQVSLRIFQEEGHVTVLHPLISRALAVFLKP